MADNAVTLPASNKSILSEQEQSAFGFTNKFRINFSDFSTVTTTGATDTVTFALGALPAKWLVDKALVNVTTAFTGITGATTIAVGTTTTVAAFVTAVTCTATGAIQMASTLPVLTNATATATKSMVVTFTTAGTGGPAAITAGQCDIYLSIADQSKLP